MRLPTTLSNSYLVPAGLVASIALLDVTQWAIPFRLWTSGPLDEAAHLATSALILTGAVGWPRIRQDEAFAAAALIASVVIDIDHVPLYLGVEHIASDGRPYSHSLATAAALAASSMLFRRRRTVLLGAALGVLLHFSRDIATGPGLVLWWPLSFDAVRAPYASYAAALLVLAGLSAWRIKRGRSSVSAAS